MPDSSPKADLRRAMRAQLTALSAESLASRSAALVKKLLAHPRILGRDPLMAFLPTAGEPVIVPVLEHRLKLGLPTALPRADWATRQMVPVVVQNLSSDCTPTRYSILQPRADLLPLALTQLDVVLVPGVAFDASGGRLGRGGGFYDRFVAQARSARPQVLIAGICFDEQVVDLVPLDAHDVRVDMILTPARTLVVRADN